MGISLELTITLGPGGVALTYEVKPNYVRVGDVIDKRKAECPSCHQKLKKIPGSKTKCPHCSKFMFVRTIPYADARVVVTREEANEIDKEWELINNVTDSTFSDKDEYIKIGRDIRKNTSIEPSDEEIKLVILNKKLLLHSKSGEWGLYRSVRYDMGILFKKTNKLNDALLTFLEVIYLDLNEPINSNWRQEKINIESDKFVEEYLRFLKDHKVKFIKAQKHISSFDPKNFGRLLPLGPLGEVGMLLEKLQLSKHKVKVAFIKHNLKVCRTIHTPLSPQECWKYIEGFFK